MAQAEDTELRDLVLEALEKNGSLAKIRALLRANIFLVFEDDCDSIKQNVNLDNILKLPEGVICLSLIHEFLEFCNLKNTLFVYMSESRQGKEYSYEGYSKLSEKLKFSKRNQTKEPVLVTLVKSILRQTKTLNHNVKSSDNRKDEQNSTYIVHEESVTSTSHSNSDNSSDEKNKLHLRLQLDNSDTDTSSDSTRGKTSSEYIPSEHILVQSNEGSPNRSNTYTHGHDKSEVVHNAAASEPEIQNRTSSRSESTSYAEIKALSSLDKILLNTTGVPYLEETKLTDSLHVLHPKTESTSPKYKGSVNNQNSYYELNRGDKQKSVDSGNDLTEYSFDFSSPASNGKKLDNRDMQSSVSVHDPFLESPHKNSSRDNSIQKSKSSSISISTSEAADIISDKSNSLHKIIESKNLQMTKPLLCQTKNSLNENMKLFDDDSGDFSESSPIPSLSNLSLDIHSD